MSRFIFFMFISTLVLAHPLFAEDTALDAVYQLSTWKALNAGLYQGFTTCADILRRGDFGIGFFASLDGEYVIMDGKPYRIATDGTITDAVATDRICFATAKIFEADQSGIRAEMLNLSDLLELFDKILQTRNLPMAVKIDGDFAEVALAAVSKQAEPYPPFSEALSGQSTRKLTNVTGTVIGFRYPSYLAEATPSGYRLYFLKRDRSLGGRVLDLRARNIRFDFDYSHRLYVDLPNWGEFYSLP